MGNVAGEYSYESLNVQSEFGGKKVKVIKDSVHGYIYIEKNVVDLIIDTIYFQRLRRIEQTSMRCVYPAARHDRFIHSIGVYYLAMLALSVISDNIKENADKLGDSIPDPSERMYLDYSFEMASLLHDVGHAPFSHTLEDFFGIENESDLDSGMQALKARKEHLVKKVCNKLGGISGKDLKHLEKEMLSANAAPHELMSCLIILECFESAIKKLATLRKLCPDKVDFELIVRCITGCQYGGNYKGKEYNNCLIRLLNSSIDVDKLDYISRDSSISGYDNVKIDIQRLLKALVVVLYKKQDGTDGITLAFGKNAVSVVQNVITSRNALYAWIYSHHKVKYEIYLFQKAVRNIAEKWEGGKPLLFFEKYFTENAIENDLVCDDDIWCLLKKERSDPLINQIFDRSEQKKTLWKSFSEFNILFQDQRSNGIGDFSLEQMWKILKNEEEHKAFKKYINEYPYAKGKLCAEVDVIIHNVKLTNLKKDSVLVYLDDKLYGYEGAVRDLYHNSVGHPFFYLFFDKVDIEKIHRDELIEYIKAYDKFKVQPDYS